ncbi:MAG: aspartate aminotransferase, partial [Actinomycetia bacterium]|nr:aspartate aminotransferase [Actinomycetes bacterium]
GVLGRTIGGTRIDTTLQLAEVALEQAKVAFVPGEAFGSPGYARFSFALGDDDLGDGLNRLNDLLASAQ